MADLLQSLVLPNNNNNSQESFHSVSSQPPSSMPPDPSLQAYSSGTPSTSQAQASALQVAGLSVYDIDAYLADPKNAGLLEKKPNGKNFQPKTPQGSNNPTEPMSLGSRTSHNVSALNNLCQTKGVQPVYEIDGNASHFGGVLRIGDVTIASDERWTSKKDAREALAEKGLDIVKAMGVKKKESSIPGNPGRNWVGMLHEYHNLTDPTRGPVYDEYALGTAYACECTIPSLPDHRFGSKTETFPSKKAARINSAKDAVEHLISKGELNADGSTKPRKKAKLGAAVRLEERGLEVKKGTSYAQKVQDICPLLGVQSPQYNLAPASGPASSMLSGYASFPDQPGMPKEIGQVRNIFGKKNAKEEVAKVVWEFLRELALKRGVRIMEADETSSE